MVLTAAVGVTLAAARGLVEYDAGWAVCMIPPAVMLELAAFRWSRSRGRMRRFWAAFVGTGLLVMASIVAAATYHGSPINRLWVAATDTLGRALFDGLRVPRPGGNRDDSTLSIEIFPIAAGLCVLGGLLGRGWAARGPHGSHDPPHPPATGSPGSRPGG